MWKTICIIGSADDDDNKEYQVDYNEDKGMYRVSLFIDNHWKDEVVFDEYEKSNN